MSATFYTNTMNRLGHTRPHFNDLCGCGVSNTTVFDLLLSQRRTKLLRSDFGLFWLSFVQVCCFESRVAGHWRPGTAAPSCDWAAPPGNSNSLSFVLDVPHGMDDIAAKSRTTFCASCKERTSVCRTPCRSRGHEPRILAVSSGNTAILRVYVQEAYSNGLLRGT